MPFNFRHLPVVLWAWLISGIIAFLLVLSTGYSQLSKFDFSGFFSILWILNLIGIGVMLGRKESQTTFQGHMRQSGQDVRSGVLGAALAGAFFVAGGLALQLLLWPQTFWLGDAILTIAKGMLISGLGLYGFMILHSAKRDSKRGKLDTSL